MSSFKYWALVAGLVTTMAMAHPQQVQGQRSGVEIWSANCGRCHTTQPPNRYSAKDWSSIAMHMAITARLTGSEADAVTAFLISGARTVGQSASESTVNTLSASLLRRVSSRQAGIEPEKVYAQQCAPCHGAEGRGDGLAAVAFDPPPGDFADSMFWSERTDLQIDSIIRFGKGSMPPLGDAVAPEDREALIKYLREKFTGGSYWRAEGTLPMVRTGALLPRAHARLGTSGGK